MIDNYIKCAAITPDLALANPSANAIAIIEALRGAQAQGVKLAVFPELCLTGYTCGDLVMQQRLLDSAMQGLRSIMEASVDMDILFAVGLPMAINSKLYNVAAVIKGGELLGLVPKTYLADHGEFSESRYYAPGPKENTTIILWGQEITFGSRQIFHCGNMEQLTVAVEIGHDLLAVRAPSVSHALNGANIILNLYAGAELVALEELRRRTLCRHTSQLVCGYVLAAAGTGESTSDMVFAGHNIICEDGAVLAESRPFVQDPCVTELDLDRIVFRRRRNTLFVEENDSSYDHVVFNFHRMEQTELTRHYSTMPFVPSDEATLRERCETILNIQAQGLARRIRHTHCHKAVIGISGGLDSSLALLASARACDILGWPHDHILAVTMPCFGTTDRTYNNAVHLCSELGVLLKHVDIRNAVTGHFADIGQDPDSYDVTYENSQARERTQVLMDLANKENGIVVGTGDLSELALGWCTYNGDHMSMYGVNSSVPKTLIRYIIRFYADTYGNEAVKTVLYDILDTPVSPELLPPDKAGAIAQKTEEVIGKYEINDFLLYYAIRRGYAPSKVYRIACRAFAGRASESELKTYLVKFYGRFFAQQFKRSCMPDGPKVGTVSMSPRGDWKMPSDATAADWIRQVEEL